MPAWQPLLEWWFGTPGAGAPGATSATAVASQRSGLWFGKRDSQDAEARQRFGGQVEQALAGGLADWAQNADGWLALLLLLDQLPRMIHRDTPQAFAGDARAQALLAEGLAAGFERQLAPIRRVFAYLVFEHTEQLPAQDHAVARFESLLAGAAPDEQALFADYLDYAERHRQVIARFGRFPHRNAILARTSSAEELAYLQEPGSGF
ncbi:DUF924 domain-containing protein [Pseudomonas sp. UL073]|uniref:DUF924 domain-containing protein n=1 Tax=Zestomonas insulae TaxID=2809017 RepID=A0ABS2IGM5_9GAMM|nr:DUF924 family protein [Pseudomonas insulae]MBM7061102.1 DUF924 domain-containing protein [Pseudomonas insulae]